MFFYYPSVDGISLFFIHLYMASPFSPVQNICRWGVIFHRGLEPGGAVIPLRLRGPGGLLQGDTQADLAQLPRTGQYTLFSIFF